MATEDTIYLEKFIEHDKQGTYFTLPFHVDQDAELIEIKYQYARFELDEIRKDSFIAQNKPEINIIDFGLIGPDGEQIGMSGSDRSIFFVSEAKATPGYQTCPIHPGEWKILVGAYKVETEGIESILQNYH